MPWRSHCRGGSSLGVQSSGGVYKMPSYMNKKFLHQCLVSLQNVASKLAFVGRHRFKQALNPQTYRSNFLAATFFAKAICITFCSLCSW